MPPAIALGRVDHFVGLLQPGDRTQLQILGVGGPDEGLGLLINQVADLAGVGIHLHHPETLMPAVLLFVSEAKTVLTPMQLRT